MDAVTAAAWQSSEVSGQGSQAQGAIPVQGQELGSVILMGPFQHRTLWDFCYTAMLI